MKKIIIIIIIATISIIVLSSFSEVQDIDGLAYVSAIGIDKLPNNKILVSFQIAVPGATGSGGEGDGGSDGGSSSNSESIISSVECNSINSAINIVNSYMSRKLNLSNCKVVVFSEEIAKIGIGNHIYTLVNNLQIRSSCNVIVSKCDAFFFLENSKPVLEKQAAKYYEVALSSHEYSGYTEDVTIEHFFASLSDTFCEPYAILGGVNTEKTNASSNPSLSKIDDGDYRASETPIKTKNNLENTGLAVFRGDKLVGELSGMDAMSHLILTNELKNAIITVPSPFSYSEFVDLYIQRNKDTNIKVSIVNGTPYVDVSANLVLRVLSINPESKYMSQENVKILSDYVSEYLQDHISKYLYTTSKEYLSDTAGIGAYAVSNFKTIQEWQDYNWLNNYQNSFFNIDTKIDITSSYLITDF